MSVASDIAMLIRIKKIESPSVRGDALQEFIDKLEKRGTSGGLSLEEIDAIEDPEVQLRVIYDNPKTHPWRVFFGFVCSPDDYRGF